MAIFEAGRFNEFCCDDQLKASQNGRWQWMINIPRDSGEFTSKLVIILMKAKDE